MRRDIEESRKAIDAFAFRAVRRAHAAGDRSLTIEDIKSELWIAWCLACDSYDAEKGVPWLAYLRNGMRLHINRYIEKHVNRRHDEVVALSLDFHSEDDGSFQDIVPCENPLPDQLLEGASHKAQVIKRLSLRARQFVTILSDQPQEILAEVRCLHAKGEYMRSQGASSIVSTTLTAAMVFDLMGANRFERTKIAREIREIGDDVMTMVNR